MRDLGPTLSEPSNNNNSAEQQVSRRQTWDNFLCRRLPIAMKVLNAAVVSGEAPRYMGAEGGSI